MPVRKNAPAPERTPAPDYDGHYKLMFGDPVMVRDLLRAFAPPDIERFQIHFLFVKRKIPRPSRRGSGFSTSLSKIKVKTL